MDFPPARRGNRRPSPPRKVVRQGYQPAFSPKAGRADYLSEMERPHRQRIRWSPPRVLEATRQLEWFEVVPLPRRTVSPSKNAGIGRAQEGSFVLADHLPTETDEGFPRDG